MSTNKDKKTSPKESRQKADKDKPKVKKLTKKTKTVKKLADKKTNTSVKKSSSSLAKKSKVPVKTKKIKNPTSMEELIQTTGYQLKTLKKGQTIKGIITEINKKHILVDIGAKTEGIVINKEYELVKDYIEDFKEGDELEAIVYTPENDKGQILLSLRKAASDFKWNLFTEFQNTGEPIEVRGLEINKGGVIARYKDIRGFVPASQFGREWLGRLRQLQNRLFIVKVIEVDRAKNRLIFSEKLVSEEKAIKSQKQALKMVKVGQKYQGIVSGIMPFGVFIRVDIDKSTQNGPAFDKKKVTKTKISKDESEQTNKGKDSLFLEGLVHISEVSWQKVTDLNKMFKVGQKVGIKVLSVNDKSGKLNLSIKQLQADPWQDLVKTYKKDSKLKGTISKLAAFGAFVSLEEGVEGLLHISKIPADYNIKVGQEIEVYVESIDIEKKKISLGLVLKTKPVGYK